MTHAGTHAVRARWLSRVSVSLGLALLLWLVAHPACITRHLDVRLDPLPGDGSSAIEWRRAGQADFNGVWIEPKPDVDGTETLTIRIPPGNGAHGGACEIWLLEIRVMDAGGTLIPRPKAEVAIGSEKARWLDSDDGTGLIYLGTTGGEVRVDVPENSVMVDLLASPRGGPAEILFAGTRMTVDLVEPAAARRRVTVHPSAFKDRPAAITQRLPAYAIDGLRVLLPERLTHGAVVEPTLRVHLLGREVASREARVLAWEPDLPAGSLPPEAPRPRARLDVRTAPPVWVHGLGVLLAWGVVGVAWPLAWGLVRAGAWFLERPWKWRAVVGGLVVGTHVWAGVSTPLILSGDALDYLVGAARLAGGLSYESLPQFKAPLFSAVLALALRLGVDPILTAQVLLILAGGVATPYLTYAALRRLTSEPYALAGALACGLNPLLLTLESYLLRETFAATVVAGAAALFARTPGMRPWRAGALLGLLAGVGALLRENFQTLLVLFPLAVLVVPGLRYTVRGRVVGALVAVVVGLACVMPWYAAHHARFGRPGMTLPKVHVNRALNAWSNGTLDLNQSRALSQDTWTDLTRRNARQRLSDYEAVFGVINGRGMNEPALIADRPRYAEDKPTLAEVAARTAWSERVAQVLADESAARAPERVWSSRATAILSLTGLWIYREHPSAPSVDWMSRPLRRLPDGFATNVRIGTIYSPEHAAEWEAMQAFISRHEQPLNETVSPGFSPWFERLFRGNQLLRPVLALLAIGACITAWRRRAWPVLAVALLVAANFVGAALVVVTPVDRVAVPFIPALIVMALWGVWAWSGPVPARVAGGPIGDETTGAGGAVSSPPRGP